MANRTEQVFGQEVLVTINGDSRFDVAQSVETYLSIYPSEFYGTRGGERIIEQVSGVFTAYLSRWRDND